MDDGHSIEITKEVDNEYVKRYWSMLTLHLPYLRQGLCEAVIEYFVSHGCTITKVKINNVNHEL